MLWELLNHNEKSDECKMKMSTLVEVDLRKYGLCVGHDNKRSEGDNER
jgi:hypothetical protein